VFAGKTKEDEMTIKQIRQQFWDDHPELEREAKKRKTRSKDQNHQTTTCRCVFVNWLDMMARDGKITERQAANATL
jgi:hypothetical protein